MAPTRAGDPLTIFHVDGERGFRGGERQVLYLAAGLRARGHVNIVACRPDHELEREARRQAFETLTLPFHFEFDPLSAWKLGRAARGRSRAVVHAHTAHAAGIAMVCRWLGGPPAVAHRRVDFPLGSRSSRFKYRRMARLVVVSEAIARVLEQGGFPRELMSVAHDTLPVTAEEWRWVGVDHPGLAPVDADRRGCARRVLSERFGLDRSKAWVGNLAALVPHKDHETLIAAAELVIRQRPETLFLIAGRGPLEERLRGAVAGRGLQGKVVLLGHQPDPADVLAALDLFVLSSSGEGMGSVLLEAAACGVPVLATSAGGIPEVIEHRRSGLLAGVRDPTELARCIVELLDDPALARRLSAAALEALPRFGLGRSAERLEELYEAIVAGRLTLGPHGPAANR